MVIESSRFHICLPLFIITINPLVPQFMTIVAPEKSEESPSMFAQVQYDLEIFVLSGSTGANPIDLDSGSSTCETCLFRRNSIDHWICDTQDGRYDFPYGG
jgi:hypothetical protein